MIETINGQQLAQEEMSSYAEGNVKATETLGQLNTLSICHADKATEAKTTAFPRSQTRNASACTIFRIHHNHLFICSEVLEAGHPVLLKLEEGERYSILAAALAEASCRLDLVANQHPVDFCVAC